MGNYVYLFTYCILSSVFSKVPAPDSNVNADLDQNLLKLTESPKIDQRIESIEEKKETTLVDNRQYLHDDDQTLEEKLILQSDTRRQGRVFAGTEDPQPIWHDHLREPESGISQQNRELIHQDIIDILPELNDPSDLQAPSTQKNDTDPGSYAKFKKIDQPEEVNIQNHVEIDPSHQPDIHQHENDYDVLHATNDHEDHFLEIENIDDIDDHQRQQSTNKVVPTKQQQQNNPTVEPSSTTSSTIPTDESSTTIKIDESSKEETTTDETPPPPEIYVVVIVNMGWSILCSHEFKLRSTLAAQLTTLIDLLIQPSQVVLLTTDLVFKEYRLGRLGILCKENEEAQSQLMSPPLGLMVYVESMNGQPDPQLTINLGKALVEHQIQFVGSSLENVVLEIRFYPKDKVEKLMVRSDDQNLTGIIAAFTISGIAGASLLLMCILLLILRHNHIKSRRSATRRAMLDTYSLDSISIYSSIRRKRGSVTKTSYLNLGFTDPCTSPSHRINFAGLANLSLDHDAVMEEEFKSIPNEIPKLQDYPELEDSSELAETPETISIKGHKEKPNAYIMCKAPRNEREHHFWRLVWDKQIKVVIMLTGLEDGNCAPYFPMTDDRTLYGDYQISLKKKEVLQHYTVSLLQIRDLELNLVRDVTHFWYTSWPSNETPTNFCSVLAMLSEARACSNSKPVLIHCNNTLGRSGTLIAIDLCLRQYEESRTVDIPNTVHTIRKQCPGTIDNVQQYSFIYRVLNEYASRLDNAPLVRRESLMAVKNPFNQLTIM